MAELPLLIAGMGALTVMFRVAVPVPVALVAEIVTAVVPSAVGVPEI